MNNTLPPALDALAHLMDAQPANVRELFQWSLAMLIVEQGKARIIEQHTMDERVYCTYATSAADVFSVVKPNVRDELLQEMMATVREIVAEDEQCSA